MVVTVLLWGDGVDSRVQTALTRRDESIAELQQAHADMASKKRNYAAARANAKGAAAAEASMARVRLAQARARQPQVLDMRC